MEVDSAISETHDSPAKVAMEGSEKPMFNGDESNGCGNPGKEAVEKQDKVVANVGTKKDASTMKSSDPSSGNGSSNNNTNVEAMETETAVDETKTVDKSDDLCKAFEIPVKPQEDIVTAASDLQLNVNGHIPPPSSKPASRSATPQSTDKPASRSATPQSTDKPASRSATPQPPSKPASRSATPQPASKPASRTATPQPSDAVATTSSTAENVIASVVEKVMSASAKKTVRNDEPETPTKEKLSKVSQMLSIASESAQANSNLRPVAKILCDIGLDLTRQAMWKGLIKLQNKKDSKGELDEKQKEQLSRLVDVHDGLLVQNESYIHETLTCKSCGFKTDSQNVLQCHYEYGHDQHLGFFSCVLCSNTVTLQSAAQFLYHMDDVHHRRGRVYMKHSFFVCPNCPYESNNHTQYTKHTEKCSRTFNASKTLIPYAADRDIPLELPRMPTRPVRPAAPTPPVAPVRAPARTPAPVAVMPYQVVANRAVTPAAAVAGVSNVYRNAFNPRLLSFPRSTTPQAIAPPPRPPAPGAWPQPQLTRPAAPGVPQPVNTDAGQFIQMNGQYFKLTAVGKQHFLVPVSEAAVPISVRNKSAQSSSPMVMQSNGQLAATQAAVGTKVRPYITPHVKALQANKGREFEVCEICGGFVKDKENLRIHFHWAHKVDIHKDVFNGIPPLVCNVCTEKTRFWTYQGLERHTQNSHRPVVPQKHQQMKKLIDEISKNCVYCLEPFSKRIDAMGFWAHMKIHGIIPASIFRTNKCCACGFIAAEKQKMQSHLRTSHALLFTKYSKKDLNKPHPQEKIREIGEVKLVDSLKGDATAAQIVDKVLANMNAKATAGKKTDKLIKMYKCNYCAYQNVDKDQIRRHVSTAHSYKCTRCKQRFNEVDSLHQHFTSKHGNEKDTCSVCKEKVKIGRAFIRHMKSNHIKDCSVIVTRMRKADTEERQDEIDDILSNLAAKKGGKRKVVTPQRPQKAKRSAGVIMVDSDTPPRKKTKPSSEVVADTSQAAPKSREVIEVDGEQIVVEMNDDDDGTAVAGERESAVSNSIHVAEKRNKDQSEINGDASSSDLGLKIASSCSLREDVAENAEPSQHKIVTQTDSCEVNKASKPSAIDSDGASQSVVGDNVATSQPEVDRITITDSSDQEVINLDTSREHSQTPDVSMTAAPEKQDNDVSSSDKLN